MNDPISSAILLPYVREMCDLAHPCVGPRLLSALSGAALGLLAFPYLFYHTLKDGKGITTRAGLFAFFFMLSLFLTFVTMMLIFGEPGSWKSGRLSARSTGIFTYSVMIHGFFFGCLGIWAKAGISLMSSLTSDRDC